MLGNIFVNPSEDFMVTIHNKIKRGRIIRMNYETGATYTETQKTFRPDERSLEEAAADSSLLQDKTCVTTWRSP